MLAGIDLAPALIEKDHGRQLALDISRFMVMVLRRQSGQTQFSPQSMAEATEDPRIRKVQLYIWENPTADLSLEALARQAGMSKRTLGRRFAEVTNNTISRYIEDVRLNMARRPLEGSGQSIQTIATNAGFGTSITMRRFFARRLGVSPGNYRASFGADQSLVNGASTIGNGFRMVLENVINGKSVW
ncbi:MAG: helix-turn-helix domain-containing protein [Hoeflea sp.]|uniref:GlxA family transcriptional regulator n=1 Tax=Hoeflea sp. TaxID=1940281 RepID=UPI0032989608